MKKRLWTILLKGFMYHVETTGIGMKEDHGMTETDVMEAAKRLAGIIRETDSYKEYLRQREILKQQPELYEQVNAYRRKNFNIQNESDGMELFDRMEAFEREYREFRENPLVDDFLRAELAFCRMMQEMNVLLTAEIDFE